MDQMDPTMTMQEQDAGAPDPTLPPHGGAADAAAGSPTPDPTLPDAATAGAGAMTLYGAPAPDAAGVIPYPADDSAPAGGGAPDPTVPQYQRIYPVPVDGAGGAAPDPAAGAAAPSGPAAGGIGAPAPDPTVPSAATPAGPTAGGIGAPAPDPAGAFGYGGGYAPAGSPAPDPSAAHGGMAAQPGRLTPGVLTDATHAGPAVVAAAQVASGNYALTASDLAVVAGALHGDPAAVAALGATLAASDVHAHSRANDAAYAVLLADVRARKILAAAQAGALAQTLAVLDAEEQALADAYARDASGVGVLAAQGWLARTTGGCFMSNCVYRTLPNGTLVPASGRGPALRIVGGGARRTAGRRPRAAAPRTPHGVIVYRRSVGTGRA